MSSEISTIYLEYRDELYTLYGKDSYIAHSQLEIIKSNHSDVDLRHLSVIDLVLKQLLKFKLKQAINIYSSHRSITKLLASRESHNNSFIGREIQKEYKLEDKLLDGQQIEAVVACEDANLVLAAAGSGKTLSLLAKVKYLHEQLGVPLSKILTISFTNNTTRELKERLTNLGLDSDGVRTFHSLGNWILKESSGKTKRLFQDDAIKRFVSKTVTDLRENDEAYARSYNDYLLYYHATPIDPLELKDEKEAIDFNKSFLRRTLQSISMKKNEYDKTRPALAGEYVRSKEEQIIANFLYINQVPYEYEKQYPYMDTKYRPDFTIEEFEEPIYLEHWGMDRNGDVSPLNGNPTTYIKRKAWAKHTHETNGTILIESYSYQWREGTLLTHIESELKRVGAELVRRKESEIAELIDKSYRQDIRAFVELCNTFLNLFKNSALTLLELEQRIESIENDYQRDRTQKFYAIFKPIYEAYEKHLNENNLQDFADMIKLATKKLQSLPNRSFEFDYILVDEVQDLSYGRFSLLKAMLDSNPGAKLFCVGDDWQSIFRFTGSDLTLIQDFESFFSRQTYRSLIEQTHRFGDPTVQLSGDFIQQNPNQSRKNVTFNSDISTPIRIHINDELVPSNRNELTVENSKYPDRVVDIRDGESVNQILTELLMKHGIEALLEKEIQIISRYNWDIDRVKCHPAFTIEEDTEDKDIKIKWLSSSNAEPIEMLFSTMHRAKGLTRDIVIVLNCNDGPAGMPATHSDDPILSLLLAHPDGFLYSEERRLFYVAITRAKEETHLIANPATPSQFLFEIEPQLSNKNRKVCPVCQTGELITRKSARGDFEGCSNFKYGCTYTMSVYSSYRGYN